MATKDGRAVLLTLDAEATAEVLVGGKLLGERPKFHQEMGDDFGRDWGEMAGPNKDLGKYGNGRLFQKVTPSIPWEDGDLNGIHSNLWDSTKLDCRCTAALEVTKVGLPNRPWRPGMEGILWNVMVTQGDIIVILNGLEMTECGFCQTWCISTAKLGKPTFFKIQV